MTQPGAGPVRQPTRPYPGEVEPALASKHQLVSIDAWRATEGGSWLAGVYEPNYYSEVWLGYSVLGQGTTRFATREQACGALGVTFDGEALITTDVAAVVRARKLPHQELLNRSHKPGKLAAFIQHAPHLDGTGLMTFALSDHQRSISAMTRALQPARDAAEARISLIAAITRAFAAPEYDEDEIFMRDVFGISPPDPGARADRAMQAVQDLTDDFRGYWDTYIASTHIGVIHASRWSPQRSVPVTVLDLLRRAVGHQS